MVGEILWNLHKCFTKGLSIMQFQSITITNVVFNVSIELYLWSFFDSVHWRWPLYRCQKSRLGSETIAKGKSKSIPLGG